MKPVKKKGKVKGFLRLLGGYGVGFLGWTAGFHCFEMDSQGVVRLSTKRFLRHLLKLFLWALEITLVVHLFALYFAWLLQASGSEKTMAILVKSVLFLYIKIFWPEVFPEILPGLHVFLCPQCYQRQTFKFLPVSLKYGFFVTYICSYCFCLVDGWGRQIFYPMDISFEKTAPVLMKTLPLVLMVLAGGIAGFEIVWKSF